jgi:hypothetical protein
MLSQPYLFIRAKQTQRKKKYKTKSFEIKLEFPLKRSKELNNKHTDSYLNKKGN